MTDADKRAALLRQEKVMAIVMNGLISIGFFFLVFGWHPASSRALALDFLPQSFGVTFLGSLVPSLITYGRISRGKVVAAGPVPGKLGHLFRIIIAALLAIVVFGGAAALLTIRFAPPECRSLAGTDRQNDLRCFARSADDSADDSLRARSADVRRARRHAGGGGLMARRFVDLSILLQNDVVTDPPFLRPKITYQRHEDTIEEARHFFPGIVAEDFPGGVGFAAAEWVTLTTHSGTHLDAPWHYHPTMDGGERAITIDEVPLDWCFRPGVKLDFRHFDNGYVVTGADVEAELARIDHDLQPLDIVLDQHRRREGGRPTRLCRYRLWHGL